MGTTADKLQAILNSKAAIKTAINNKGGSITDSTPLDEYATAIGNIQTPILQSKTASPSTSQQTITPDGGYNGLSQVTIDAVTSSIDANIQAGNIKKDVTILGVTGTFEGGGGGSNLDKLIDGTITSVTSSATSIRKYCFAYLSSLTNVTLNNATLISNAAFYETTGLTSISMPSVTTIETTAFYHSGISSLHFPLVTSIGTTAFATCTNLQVINSTDLPLVSNLLTSTFTGCTSLREAHFPQVNGIGQRVFQGCTSLTDLYLERDTVVIIADTTVFNNLTGPITVHVPSNQISNYQTTSNWVTLYNNGVVTFVAI